MTSALLAALATALLVPGPSVARLRTGRPTRRGPEPVLAVTVLVPLACLVLLGPVAGAVVALGATPAARGLVLRLESSTDRRRRELMVAQLPTALELVVAVLDAGRSPGPAMALVAATSPEPLATELGLVASRLEVTGDPAAVWDRLGSHAVLGGLGRAFRRAQASGMPVARVVEQVAAEQRRVVRGARREQARRVGVRTAAPLGLCFLPAFFCIGIVPTLLGVFAGLDLAP